MNFRLAIFGLFILSGLFGQRALANATFLQSIVGSGCSSLCINGQCTSTCNSDRVSSDSNTEPQNSEYIEMSGFDTILANNINLKLYKSNKFNIEVISTGSIKPKLKLRLNESTLIISPAKANRSNKRIDVSIGMPSLKFLKQSGDGDLLLNEFIQATMKLDLSGTGKLKGTSNRVETLNVNLAGAIEFDLTSSQVRDAVVHASGVNQILLNFPQSKGTLAGKIEGVNTLSYCGSPVDKLEKNGIAKRFEIECL